MPCRVEDVIEKNLTFLSAQIKEAGCRVHQNYQKKLPEIMGDAVMLYQAFLNILINSIQAMQNGGDIHVHVASSNHTVTVLFQDQGSGIPEALLEKIWDPFFTTKEKGTGLGLVIVKNIIESHRGSIQIENRPAGGAQVKVDLPAK
jgi:C4-dicarboxylate-specific signal transduction histidine kinase